MGIVSSFCATECKKKIYLCHNQQTHRVLVPPTVLKQIENSPNIPLKALIGKELIAFNCARVGSPEYSVIRAVNKTLKQKQIASSQPQYISISLNSPPDF